MSSILDFLYIYSNAKPHVVSMIVSTFTDILHIYANIYQKHQLLSKLIKLSLAKFSLNSLY